MFSLSLTMADRRQQLINGQSEGGGGGGRGGTDHTSSKSSSHSAPYLQVPHFVNFLPMSVPDPSYSVGQEQPVSLFSFF